MRRLGQILHIVMLVVLCLLGLIACGVLLYRHLSSTTGGGWVDAVCGQSAEWGVSNCDKVTHSRWGTILGMPTAFWGTIYFLTLMLWFLFIGRPSPEGRCWHVLPTLASVLGAAGSVFFVVNMYTQLEQRCTWCLASHVANFLILGLTLLLWPSRQRAEDVDDVVLGTALVKRAPRTHPSVRLALAVILSAVLFSVCLAQAVWMANTWTSNQTIRTIAKVMYGLYQEDSVPSIAVRPDDPQKTAGDDRLHLQTVVFADFSCSHCWFLSNALEKEFNPLLDGHLQIVFKHYPLCSDCNPYVFYRSDDNPCGAARAAEAARLQGGNEAFWRAHDLLFDRARRGLLKELNYRQVAEELHLDPDRFVADAESQDVARRIREDTDLAQSLGVTTTPAVFVCGRRVPAVVATQPTFWEAVARMYATKVGQASRHADGDPQPSGLHRDHEP